MKSQNSLEITYTHPVARFLMNQKLRDAFCELEKWFGKTTTKWEPELLDKFKCLVKKHGIKYKTLKPRSGSARVILIGSTIIKFGGTSDLRYKSRVIKKALPTIHFILCSGKGIEILVRIQPRIKVDPKSSSIAYRKLLSMHRDLSQVGWDFHVGNVGLYKNTPVVHDW